MEDLQMSLFSNSGCAHCVLSQCSECEYFSFFAQMHATCDTWSSNYRQDQYISFTVYYVKVMRAGQDVLLQCIQRDELVILRWMTWQTSSYTCSLFLQKQQNLASTKCNISESISLFPSTDLLHCQYRHNSEPQDSSIQFYKESSVSIYVAV